MSDIQSQIARLKAAVAGNPKTCEVVSAELHEVCCQCDEKDKTVSQLKRQHPSGLHEIHPAATKDVEHVLALLGDKATK